MAAKRSGLRLGKADIPTVLGMVARNDRRHDIAAWFGVNQGRIADAQAGKYGLPDAAPAGGLPPTGPPGIKGRHLREEVRQALGLLKKGTAADIAQANKALAVAIKDFDADEP